MLELDAITIATPQRVLVKRLSARVAGGEVLVVMGESGVGKSSLLAMLAGILPGGFIATGSIRLDGREITALTTAERRVRILFQDHHL
jgi:putative thiamine transport system ATP-binding protein